MLLWRLKPIRPPTLTFFCFPSSFHLLPCLPRAFSSFFSSISHRLPIFSSLHPLHLFSRQQQCTPTPSSSPSPSSSSQPWAQPFPHHNPKTPTPTPKITPPSPPPKSNTSPPSPPRAPTRPPKANAQPRIPPHAISPSLSISTRSLRARSRRLLLRSWHLRASSSGIAAIMTRGSRARVVRVFPVLFGGSGDGDG